MSTSRRTLPDDPCLKTPEPLSTAALCDAMEALLFAARTPCKKSALRASIKRVVIDHEGEPLPEPEPAAAAADATGEPADAPDATQQPEQAEAATPDPTEEPFALRSPEVAAPSFGRRFDLAFRLLMERWGQTEERGFGLVAVADGYAFRTRPRFGPMLRREREGKPGRLSKPALEALAIVAYKQPVTKPEVDHLRGVDSGGGLKVLLERQLIEVTGKKDEPGRPLLYATTAHFLDFFALPALDELPSLRQYQELHDEHLEQSRALGLNDLAALAEGAPRLAPTDHQAAAALAEAMDGLSHARSQARQALAEHGIQVDDADDAPPGASPAPHQTGTNTLH